MVWQALLKTDVTLLSRFMTGFFLLTVLVGIVLLDGIRLQLSDGRTVENGGLNVCFQGG